MRGVYKTQVDISSVSAAKTLLLGTVPSSAVVEILSATVTDADQTNAEQLRIALTRVNSLGSPSSGTSPTTNKSEAGSAATGVTWYGDANPTSFVSDHIDYQAVTNMAGYYYDPLPEERPIIAPGASFGLRLLNSPSNSLRLIAQITYREIG